MEIRKVGVLGAGQMGLGIAQATARAGFETILAKATPGGLDAQRGRVEKQLQKDVERGKLSAADHGALLERLGWTTHLHDLANVDLLIESIVEELPVKRDFFVRLDDVVQDQAIFATNTSTLTVGDLASATKRPERCVGLHREARDLRIRLDREWNPAERMRTEGRLREVQEREARAGCR